MAIDVFIALRWGLTLAVLLSAREDYPHPLLPGADGELCHRLVALFESNLFQLLT